MNTKQQCASAASDVQIKESELCEVTATRKPVTGDSVAPVSPAISLAVSPASHREKPITEVQGSQSSYQSGNGNTKVNCYECKHRRDLTYSSHSECKHPMLEGKGRVLGIASVMYHGRFEPFGLAGNRHGIKHGWFGWPLDFDPIWLESCNKFEGK